MKPFALFAFLLIASPLVVIGDDHQNTTEKAATKSETNLDQTNLEHSPTTDSSAKDNALHQQPKKAEEPFLTKKDAPFLHRIPVYQSKNPLLETITNLESKHGGEANKPELSKAKEGTNAHNSDLELPIPSRCPHITGTVEEEEKKGDLAPMLLGVSSKPAAAQRGCRFFIMNELMDRSSVHFVHASAEDQLNRTLQSCFKSCTQAYDNGTDVCEACFDGCRKTAKVTEAIKKTLTDHEVDELEREEESELGGDMHRSFSIIIPLRPFPETEDEESKDPVDPTHPGSDPFPSMMPNAIKMMLQMMHQMTDRARLAMMARGQGNQVGGFDGGNGNIQESETSIDPAGNSISVSRSMSVLMTKDKDGHSKMLVVHTLPKVQIHRFGANPFGSDDDDEASHRFHDLSNDKDNHHETEDEDDDLAMDDDDFRLKFFGIGHHRGTNNNAHQTKDGHDVKEGSSTQVFYYRSRLCYYLPRLFYITLAILVLYLILWMFCAVPSAIYNRNNARRGSTESGMAIISSGNGNGGDKRKKFFFTNNNRYFALNNKSNSTTSLPPPYPGADGTGESCAEPLPEKQPLPEGGLDLKTGGDK